MIVDNFRLYLSQGGKTIYEVYLYVILIQPAKLMIVDNIRIYYRQGKLKSSKRKS